MKCYGAHTATVRLRASKATRRKLVQGARGKRTVKLLLTTTMEDLGQPAKTVRRTIVSAGQPVRLHCISACSSRSSAAVTAGGRQHFAWALSCGTR